jgi:hypothetical protein
MSAQLDSIELLAYLDGAWVDITADTLSKYGISAKWGINGIGKFDLLADIGELNFSLLNNTGKYYPDGGSALTGWTRNVPVKLVLTYDAVEYVRFRGYVEDIKIHVGKHDNESYVSVRALDWMKFADRFPLTDISTQLDKRADEGIQTVVSAISPAPLATSYQTGTYTFPVIFDGSSLRATGYSEFAKLAYSELGHLYLRKDKTNGETLTFTNSTYDTSGALDGVVIEADIDDVEMHYGENIINRATAVAYPKRIDTEPQVLYSLSKPMPIKAGEVIIFRAKYTDPDGGSRVNAIESTMLTPEVPGDTDPYLKTLLNFSDGMTEEMGLHTWTNHGSGGASLVFNDIYSDSAGTHISGNILGKYMVFGGYAPGYISAPSSADFNFGSGAFTVSWYENRINRFQARATMARDMSTVPAFMFGKLVDGKDMKLYMSSGGGTFDIADGKSMGELNTSRWTHYEISRDEDGWFYSFADGKLQDKWYSALALRTSSSAFVVGKTKLGHTFFGFDAFCVWKGTCKHKKDFEPPKRNPKPTLDGDYLMNLAEDGTGTDTSQFLNVYVSYGAEAVTYALENTFATSTGYGSGFITFLQARGKGVYSYNSIEHSVEDETSITDFGYKEEKIDQPYQQDLSAGTEIITELVGQEKDPRTELRAISFIANRNDDTMSNFLNLDVRDLVNIVHASSGIDNFYRINNISFDMSAGGKFIKYTWGLCPMLEVDDIVTTPIDPTFQGVVGISDISQSQTIDTVTMTQDYLLDIEITIEDIEQSQTIDFNLPEMSVYLISSNVTGLGDVIGDTVPTVAGRLSRYADTSGKHIEQSGILSNSIAGYEELITTDAGAASNDDGTGFVFTAGDGDGTGTGGTVQFDAGTGGATGVGGNLTLDGGQGGATSGVGGSAIIQAGAGGGTSSTGGQAELSGGLGGAPNGDGGDVVVRAGNPTGSGSYGETILKFGGVGLKLVDDLNTTAAHLAISTLSAARSYELPDADGTIALAEIYLAKTADYTLLVTDSIVDVTANNVNITLPTAVGYSAKIFHIKNSGTGTVTILTTSGQTVDGAASGTVLLNQYDCITVFSNGANWIII